MSIENEMLARFNSHKTSNELFETSLSNEIDFFFDNVMDTVVDFFETKELTK